MRGLRLPLMPGTAHGYAGARANGAEDLPQALMTLGFREEEAEQEILDDFLG